MRRLKGACGRVVRRSRAGVVLCILLATWIAVSNAAQAQNDTTIPGIFGAIIRAALIESARKSWLKVDPNVRQCLVQRYNISPDQLYQQGIKATDSRVVQYVQACQQAIAQAREQQQEQQRIQEEQQRAAAAQAEAEREAQEKAARDAENARLEAAAQAEAQKKAKRAALVAKYGSTIADEIMSGTIVKGMTTDQVLEARGEPDRRESFPPDSELWSYGADRIGFYKGHVTHVGH